MDRQQLVINLSLIILCLLVMSPMTDIFASASYDATYNDAYDLYSYLEEVKTSKEIYDYLKDNGWIREGVSYDEFDYILVLTQQLTYGTKLRHSLILAQIAVESGFYQYDKYDRAYGYMQLMPIYHSKRMEQFVEEGHLVDLDDFYDPRLNIATGIDYMEELLEESGGYETIALTKYNQGYYRGTTNSYAKKILDLSYEIETILNQKEVT